MEQEEALAAAAGVSAVGGIFILAIMVLMIASMWRIFTKAGKPGWAAIIPIYNIVVMLQIAGKPLWWIVGLFIPFVNFVVMILVTVAIAKAFGKGVGFAIGMILLGIVFYPMLAFGNATYTAPAES
jgi:hypothetical protein